MPTEIHNAAIADSPVANQSLDTNDSPTFVTVTCTTIAPSLVSLPTGAAGITGTATLSSGTATVSTTAVTTNSKIFLTWNGAGTLTGILHADTIVAATSFVITSSGGSDSAQINWLIVN